MAWWTPLVHLSRFGLGLAYTGAGLGHFMRSDGDGSDAADKARLLIDMWWGERVQDFVAWGVGGGDEWLVTGGPWDFDVPRRLTPAPAEDLWRVRQTASWKTTWGGGGDALHLASHSCHPLAENESVRLAARGDHLVLRSAGYGGWYRSLMQLAVLSPAEGGTAVVEIQGFGELGTFSIQAGTLPRLCALPVTEPHSHRSSVSSQHAAGSQDRAAGPPLVFTVLAGAIGQIREHLGTRFLLDVPSGHGGDGAYTQAMSLHDGRVYAEVPSDQFLTPPLTQTQHKRLLELGWAPPDADTPNHWREWPADMPPSAMAAILLSTLTSVYDVTGGEFSLAPAALAAQVFPDSVEVSLIEDGQSGPDPNFRSWLAAIEQVGGFSPTAVALSVARCLEVDAARAQVGHPCRPIVTLQPADSSRFQVPEAWAGNIRDGRIVFISSNPSISQAGDHQSGSIAEMYPTADWADDDIADFVLHRFDSASSWATPAGHFKRQDGTLSPKPVAFWNNVRRRASEILTYPGDIPGYPADPSQDYAMTEVVHCKSKRELGVAAAAARTCADRHLDSILRLSPAQLIVVLGKSARLLLADIWDLGPTFGTQKGQGWRERDNIKVVDVGGRSRLVVYLWHPTGSTAPKTVAGAYPEHREALWALTHGLLTPKDVFSGATTTMDMLFAPKPISWGLRGDAYLWDAMRETLGNAPLPVRPELAASQLREAFRDLVGVDLLEGGRPNARQQVYVERFAHGGMSSGYVDLRWWRETGFPLLDRRLRETCAR